MRYARNLMLLAALLALAMLSSCGGNRSATTPQLSASASSAIDLSGALAELQAAPPPEGVDAALWEGLKDELASQLNRRRGGKVASRAPTRAIEDMEGPDNTPPTEPPYHFRWTSSFFRGDGNQSGNVDILDITPLAAHFTEAVDDNPSAVLADCNRDGYVDIRDVSTLAWDFGATVDHFEIELATMVGSQIYFDEYPPEPLATLAYSESVGASEFGFKTWEFEFADIPNQSCFWLVFTPADALGDRGKLKVVEVIVPWHVPFQVDDLALDSSVVLPDVGVTWTTAFFKGDGNQDGSVTTLDVTSLVACFGYRTSEVPEATVADYDSNGTINMGELGVLQQCLLSTCWYFEVETSTGGPDGGYELNGSVIYGDSAEVNQYGFRVYRYTLADPPETRPFWVRVTPYDCDSIPGVPWEPLEIAE